MKKPATPSNTTTTRDGTTIKLSGTKPCTHCGETLPLSDFGMRRMKPGDGDLRVQPQCKKCRARYGRNR